MDHQEEVATNSAVVKGKRTKRHRPNSPLPFRVTTPSAASSESAATAPATATSDLRINTEEEEDMANCLIMLAQGRRFPEKFTSRRFLEGSSSGAVAGGGYYVYECKTCSKAFPSFQALGGHRASHKKPKLAAAAAAKEEEAIIRRSTNNNIVLSDEDDVAAVTAGNVMITTNNNNNNNFTSSSSLSLQLTNRALYTTAHGGGGGGNKQRVHECSICGAEFASGQALGGHMRRHRGPTSAAGGSQTALTLQEEEKRSPSTSSAVEPTLNGKKPSLDLDLNLPAMPETEEVNASESKLIFAGKQPATDGRQQQPPAAAAQQKQQIVFSPPPALVDCHY